MGVLEAEPGREKEGYWEAWEGEDAPKGWRELLSQVI